MNPTGRSTLAVPPEERLIVALDLPSTDAARALVGSLGSDVRFYKIGLELLMTGGYFELLDWLKAQGKRVFVDLKFFDVPQTVGAAVRQLRERGADFTTVHGNDAMLAAAATHKGAALKVLAVTALTSLDQGDLTDLGFACDVEALVLSRARRALALGCDGVISSGLEVPALRAGVDPRLVVVTPGIRPVANVDDQKRVVDVESAFARGADYIVMGRPIHAAADPAAAARDAQARIRAAFAAAG